MGKVLKIQNTRRRNLVKVAKNSQVVLEPKNLLVTAKASPIFRLTKNQDIYARAKKMASINFGSLSTRPNLKISNNNRLVLAQSLFENGSRRKNTMCHLVILQSQADLLKIIFTSRCPCCFSSLLHCG